MIKSIMIILFEILAGLFCFSIIGILSYSIGRIVHKLSGDKKPIESFEEHLFIFLFGMACMIMILLTLFSAYQIGKLVLEGV